MQSRISMRKRACDEWGRQGTQQIFALAICRVTHLVLLRMVVDAQNLRREGARRKFP